MALVTTKLMASATSRLQSSSNSTNFSALPPNLNFLSITGDYSEGAILTASYGYIGGHKGKSIYNWYLHEVETDPGMLIPEVSGSLQYSVTKDAIGSPRLLSLQVLGTAVEGTTLHVNEEYWGGEEGESIFRWFRTSSDGMQKEVADATTSSYLLSVDDIVYFISVSCEPVRKDCARGPIVLSEQIAPVPPGPPTCQSLEFHGSMLEGERLTFIASYSGGLVYYGIRWKSRFATIKWKSFENTCRRRF